MSAGRALAALALGAALLAGFLVPACVENDLEARFVEGLDLIFENRYADAEGHFLALSREMSRSKQPDAFAYRARSLYQVGCLDHLYLNHPRRAVSRLREAIKINPQADFAFDARQQIAGIFLDQIGDYRAAALEFERLVHDFPERSDADRYQYRVAQCYFLLKDYDQSRTEARILLNRWPNGRFKHEARLLLANAYYLEGKLEEAAKAHEQLLAASPKDSVMARSHFEMGMCHQELGDTANAEKAYLAALKNHPRPDLVQMQLAALRKQIAQAEDPAKPLTSPTAGKVFVPKTKSRPKSKTEPKPKPKPKTKPKTEGKLKPKPEPEAKPKTEAKPKAETQPKTEIQPKVELPAQIPEAPSKSTSSPQAKKG